MRDMAGNLRFSQALAARRRCMDRRQGEQVLFANTPEDRKTEVDLVRDY